MYNIEIIHIVQIIYPILYIIVYMNYIYKYNKNLKVSKK